MALSPGDPHSHSRPDLVAVTHTRLELSVNFVRRVLEGKAILTIQRKVSTCNELVLDIYKLKIFEITTIYERKLTFTTENHNDMFGRKLIIELPNVGSADHTEPTSSNKIKVDYKIIIRYETSPESPALYWLEPHQTSDRTHPLLISNSKLTYARAIFPCQDTPSNRFTFYSQITVPRLIPRGFNVMMPGNKGRDVLDDRVKYTFDFHRQRITIAPYEIYIIVGSLTEASSINIVNGLRYNLWTEERYSRQSTQAINEIMAILPNIKVSYNFTDEVNVCVLPPNVPEFDMQYPYMTFVSSTLLGGHYSMIDRIVQNIIESWIGRMVKIEHFKHLWLIKGLSTFINRNPINNMVDDEDIRKFLKIKDINNVLRMPELLTDSLVPDLTGKLPMNIIKYVSEKGCVFLNYLQDTLGGPVDFKRFLAEDFFPLRLTYEVLTTDRFKTSLCQRFSEHELLDSVDWDGWLYGPGFPSPHHNSTTIKSNWHLKADIWVEQESRDYNLIDEVYAANDFVKIEFLTYVLALPTVLPKDKLQMLKFAFLNDQEICEIRFLWLRLCIKSRDLQIQIDALNFACEYCMPKYACPIFRDLYECDRTRELARSRFMDRNNRAKMLPETIEKLSSILEVDMNGPEFIAGRNFQDRRDLDDLIRENLGENLGDLLLDRENL